MSTEIEMKLPFVFIDKENAYKVVKLGGHPWLCYWHADKKWVTHSPVRDFELESFYERRLPDEQAAMYEPDYKPKADIPDKTETALKERGKQ